MRLYEQSESDEFRDVELESRESTTQRCIDYASGFYVWIVLLSYLGLIVMNGFIGLTAPSKLAEARLTIPITFDAPDKPISIDLRMMDLAETDYQIELKCMALRGGGEDVSIPVKMTESHRYIRNFVDVGISEPVERETEIVFHRYKRSSVPFTVVPITVNRFDSVAVTVSFKFDDPSVEGFKFSYTYANPGCVRFRQLSRYIMSACILYCLVVFVIGRGLCSCTSMMAVIMGILGVLASNPIAEFLRDVPVTKAMIGTISMACFVNFFRFFVLCQLNIMKNERDSLSWCFLLTAGSFFIAQAIVDARAEWERDMSLLKYVSSANDWSLAPSEIAQYVFIGLHMLIVLSITSRVRCRENPGRDNLKAFCLFIVLFIPFVTLISSRAILDAFHIGYYVSFPELIVDSSNMLGAAACLLWMKPFKRHDDMAPQSFVLDNGSWD